MWELFESLSSSIAAWSFSLPDGIDTMLKSGPV